MLEWFNWFAFVSIPDRCWLRTRDLASYLGVHRNTLGRLVQNGVLRDGRHRRKINPLSPRGDFVWDRDAVLIALGRL